ncbi:unnamed protein product [Closterium sp. NIES-64]|nr:unnamed protein product [Closterium sp. NIES-64]
MADPGSSEAQGEAGLKERGNAEFKAKNFLKAAALYTQAIKEAPDNHALYSNRSAAFLQLSKLTKALADAEAAIRLNPAWEKGYYRKGCALEAMKRYDEALEAFREAAERSPGSESNAGESKAGESNAGESKAGESNAGESNAGESHAGESNAGESIAGESNAGESNAGESNAGESNAGESNAGEPPIDLPPYRPRPLSASPPIGVAAYRRDLALLPPVHSHASLIILSPCLSHNPLTMPLPPAPFLSPTALTSTFINLLCMRPSPLLHFPLILHALLSHLTNPCLPFRPNGPSPHAPCSARDSLPSSPLPPPLLV